MEGSGPYTTVLNSSGVFNSDKYVSTSSSSSTPSSSMEIYMANRTTNMLVLTSKNGYGELAVSGGGATPISTLPDVAASAWEDDQTFLGHIDPNQPYVETFIDMHQSALGTYWGQYPFIFYDPLYPFDEKGKYFLGAS